jgi:uncharacterized coiled-coil protein SlyX
LPERRFSSIPRTRPTAAEVPKSVELESRIARLELLLKGVREELAARQRTEAALKAELDHLWARIKLIDA